ncbi:AzlD domain-containing protein [Cytobacillus solani]|uniref:Branched-chain amino acid ABC transporter n=1 Tax=Cytobacillus solani TaxID=1637975 RepID=A0A0Q3VJW0_9BACI|nr:AzlD domain-containing protein [Cytobacillus solani]KOP79900.1 branched-chain amino acid ABC transporter [Bacillus sp. FJAT-21945]KQL21219.1 branched-chain amino acid ABC transporter [Cytobacillus solani]
MEIRPEVFLIIIGGALVTLIPRVFPLVFLSKINIPDWGLHWLRHIPVAIMASLIAEELLPLGEKSGWEPMRLLAAVVSLIIAIFTRSLLLTVGSGVVTLFLLYKFF